MFVKFLPMIQKVLKETWDNSYILYTYDVDGSLISFNYNCIEYFYVKNTQNDILKITDSSGNILVTYDYDSFGNTIKVTDTSGIGLSSKNPYRYRSYRYDTETGYYYLNQRYYDPKVGRFISQDNIGFSDPSNSKGLNLYTYCLNNPVMYSDPSGKFAISILAMVIIGTVVGGALGFGFDVGGQLINNGWNFNEVDWGSATNSTIVGAALGFSMAMGVGYLGPVIAGASGASGMAALGAFGVSATVSFGAGALGYTSEEWINGKTPDFGKAMMHGGFVAIEGMINFGVGGVIGSMGNIGTKGPNPFRSLEWWGKLTFGQMYTQPSKISIDLIRKNL